MITNLNVKQTK